MDNGPYWIVLEWGVAVMVSWAGWGSMAARVAGLNRGVRPDWGLRAAWGMGVTMALGSVLLACHLATALAMQLVVLAGIGMACADTYLQFSTGSHRKQLLRNVRQRGPWLVPLWILAGVAICGSVESIWLNPWDDLPAYLPYLEKMLATGTINEPFAWRRLSTYGGQLILQGQVESVGSVINAWLVDKGLALAVFLALVAGLFRGKSRRAHMAMLAIGVLAAFCPIPRVNTQSQATGAVLFLALIRTLALYRPGERRRMHVLWLVAILGAGLVAFRMNMLPGAVLAVVLVFAGKAWQRRISWPRAASHATIALALMAVFLIPWAGALYESSGSLFYPLMRGTQRPEIDGMMHAGYSPGELLAHVGRFLIHWQMVLIMLPIICIGSRRRTSGLLLFYLAAIASAAIGAAAFSMANYTALYRYGFPMLFAAALVALAEAVRRRWQCPRFFCATIITTILFAANALPGLRQQRDYLKNARDAIAGTIRFQYPTYAEDYRTAQEQIPRGEPIFSMVSAPYLLDFQRNPITLMDRPGIASPDPGMPLQSGPDALADYLKARGYHYLLAADFDTTGGVYSRGFSLLQRDHPEKFIDYDPPDAITSRLLLLAVDLVDQLAAHHTVFSTPIVRVIKLD